MYSIGPYASIPLVFTCYIKFLIIPSRPLSCEIGSIESYLSIKGRQKRDNYLLINLTNGLLPKFMQPPNQKLEFCPYN